MKHLLVVAGIAFLLVAPLLTSNAFFQHLMIMVLFWTLLGASWNLLGGFAGQVSFGHAAFLGLGGVDVGKLRFLRGMFGHRFGRQFLVALLDASRDA